MIVDDSRADHVSGAACLLEGINLVQKFEHPDNHFVPNGALKALSRAVPGSAFHMRAQGRM
jgi:hypothetical protein